MLAGASVLQSLLFLDSFGFPQLQIVSRSFRSIGVRSEWKGIKLEHLLLMDAPCLQRLLVFEGTNHCGSRMLCRGTQALGKASKALDKSFAERSSR
jgi:hypothetical protein